MTHAEIGAALMLAGGTCLGAAALPGLLRRAARLAWLAWARAHGRMRPFAGRALIIDGDTIMVEGVRVRLFGMDAPELDQAGGPEARRHLARLIDCRRLEIFPRSIDVYGRTVALARLGGRDLGRAMVFDGYARAAAYWSWRYLGTEARARLARRGLWAPSRVSGIGDPSRHRAARKVVRFRARRR